MEQKNDMTSIAVSPKTLERLNSVGKMGQTKDELINQLIFFWERYGNVIKEQL